MIPRTQSLEEAAPEPALHVVRVDVVVVGAGPTGLLSAILLANAGHRVGLIEKWPEPYPLPRAVGINHETLRVLQRARLIDDVRPDITFTADGSRIRHVLAADGEVLSIGRDSGESISGWPERANFYQPDFERTLNRRAAAHPNITVLRGWNVTEVHDGNDRASVAAVSYPVEGRTLVVHGAFVVGCDGANSVVRSGDLAEIHDLGFAYDWLVVDVQPHAERAFVTDLGQILGPPRPTTLVRTGAGRRRFEFMLVDGETAEQMNRPETAWRLLAPFEVSPGNANLERHAVYTFRALWATRWRSGRRLLAGDAAHLMPPFLGEGFNSGVRDAAALSWRLDLVLRGVAPTTLLDSYGTERIGHVRQIIEQAVHVGRLICVLDPVEAEARNDRYRAARDSGEAQTRPATWRLGPGFGLSHDPHAFVLGVQGRVRRETDVGLFDDLVAHRGFVLLGRFADPLPRLSRGVREAFERVGGMCAHVGAGSPLVDVDGTYERWFAERSVDVALFRPDLYVFGTSPSSDAEPLVVELLAQLAASVEATDRALTPGQPSGSRAGSQR